MFLVIVKYRNPGSRRKIYSYRLVPGTPQPSRDLSQLLLLDKFPSLESFVTKISLKLALCSKKHDNNIVLQCDMTCDLTDICLLNEGLQEAKMVVFTGHSNNLLQFLM